MADEKNTINILVIILFSAGIVLVGYTELLNHFNPNNASGSSRNISRELHGEQATYRADKTPKRAGSSWWPWSSSEVRRNSDDDQSPISQFLQKMAP